MDKQKRTISLSEEIDKELRMRSAFLRKPASSLIEEALKQYFKTEEKKDVA